ncbi:MAG: VWA domain-containing protein, partial [Tsuneonella sp.]
MVADALLAVRLFVSAPRKFGGIALRGFGPVREHLMEQVAGALAAHGPVVRIPPNADAELLLGGLDLAETLARGTEVKRPGLLDIAEGGVAIVPMAERMSPGVAAHLANAIDRGALAIILLDDGLDADEAPPPALLERVAFLCDLSSVRSLDISLGKQVKWGDAPPSPLKKQRSAIAATAFALGITSVRPILFAEACARLVAVMRRSEKVRDEDLETAVRLALAPRALHLPEIAEASAPEPERPESEPGMQDEADRDRERADIPLDDLLLTAAQAAIPQNVLDGISQGSTRLSGGQAGRARQKERSTRRGRPLGSVPGLPGDGRRLSVFDSLRAAAPWQTLRRAAVPDDARPLHIRKSDLRIRRFEQNRESLIIFAVDASGSSALSRLAEAKGAVELMLAEAHVKRAQVALVAFRHADADVLLPPTRSLTRARRALTGLPGGGGTPLAAGLHQA